MASDNPAPPIRTPPLGLPLWAWFLLLTLCGLSANLFHDTLIDPIAIAVYFLIGISLIVFFHVRGTSEMRSRSIVGWNGLFLCVNLYLCTMFAWFVAEIVSRGRSGEEV